MPPTKAHRGNNDQRVPDTMSRSSSMTVVSPIIIDGIDEIASKLAEIDDIIEDISPERSPDTVHIPDTGELFHDISKLQEEVKEVKLAQDAQIKDIRNNVENDVKKEIAKMLEKEISVFITDSVASQVKKEMMEWGSKPGVSKLASALQDMANENDALLKSANIQLDNSRSRHANSTVDVDFNFRTTLKQIRREDGSVSQLFPTSLRHLFSYDTAKLIQLLKEHDLTPLGKHSENLNRFLIFIGVNISVPDQHVDLIAEEQLPAYPTRDTAGAQDEGTEKQARRHSSASGKWLSGFLG